nr:hypothetical protein CFP56_67574 [Quercus suber]
MRYRSWCHTLFLRQSLPAARLSAAGRPQISHTVIHICRQYGSLCPGEHGRSGDHPSRPEDPHIRNRATESSFLGHDAEASANGLSSLHAAARGSRVRHERQTRLRSQIGVLLSMRTLQRSHSLVDQRAEDCASSAEAISGFIERAARTILFVERYRWEFASLAHTCSSFHV